jgi:hypothetical protein
MCARNALLFGGVLMLLIACATTTGTPPSVNVSGNWAGTWSYENPTMGPG